MSQPEQFTAAQASDPTTPGQVLADIAALRPDLRPAVAANPSTYPALLDWLKSLGDPAVDAALAARPAPAAAPAPQPTQPMPAAQPTQPLSPAGQAPPAWGQQPAPGAAQPAPGYGAPGAPGYGPTPPGQPPQGAYTPGYAGTPPKKSRAGLVIGIIVGIIVLVGLMIFLLVKFVFDRANDAIGGITDELSIASAMEYGDNAYLDGLYDRCADGDWEACDDLYRESNPASEYRAFGDTCGGAWESGTTTYCVDAMTGGGDDEGDPGEEDPGTVVPPSDVSQLGADAADYSPAELLYYMTLAQACADENWGACDELYLKSPFGSDFEAFADTCGARNAGGPYCTSEFGGGSYEPPMAFGDSVGLDVLQMTCEAGDADSCEVLYAKSPSGSAYEQFALDNG